MVTSREREGGAICRRGSRNYKLLGVTTGYTTWVIKPIFCNNCESLLFLKVIFKNCIKLLTEQNKTKQNGLPWWSSG